MELNGVAIRAAVLRRAPSLKLWRKRLKLWRKRRGLPVRASLIFIYKLSFAIKLFLTTGLQIFITACYSIFIMKKIILKSEKDTIAFASQFAKKLSGGQVVGLVGELGVGKTFFTKALGKALGVKETIKSPSFNLMKVYDFKKVKHNIKTFVHVDCYRLDSARGLVDIGLLDYIERDDVLVVIEWADKVGEILPKEAIWLEFEVRDDDSRVISFK